MNFLPYPRLGASSSPWDNNSPVREELFGIERLEQHAESLAAAQTITNRPPAVLTLRARLKSNAKALRAAYRIYASELERGHTVVPAADWLLDNFHIVEEQIREIRDDLPPGYYRQLPKLATGPFAGYPRVFGLAWAFVAHTDSHLDTDILRRYLAAYQRVQPLTIGELWAVAITLRIVLIENLRRLADDITAVLAARAAANALANRLIEADDVRAVLENDGAYRSSALLSAAFAAHLAKRLREQDPKTMTALEWLEERLGGQGTTIEQVVLHSQQQQSASNLSVRNVITSMRLISNVDWTELFESVSLVDQRLRAGSAFGAMDFRSRDLYRDAIEDLARGSSRTELEVADLAIGAAQAAASEAPDEAQALRVGDPGYHLIAGGRRAFEQAIGFKSPFRLRLNRLNLRLGIRGYLGAILLTTTLLLALVLQALALPDLDRAWLVLFALVAFLPATEVATALVNRAVTRGFGPRIVPGLELKSGVPESLRTLVAVPTLLVNEDDLLEQIERLETHFLSGIGGDLTFALLTDGADADSEVVESDARLLALATEAIAELNARYGPGPAGDRFLLLHRRRVFNPAEGKWMGWERKRGKLHELNRLLRGATDTTFQAVDGRPPQVPANVRYVITLDADTRLPRDAAARLVGKMAHPLNRPVFDKTAQRVVDGYAILQPRVTPALPLRREGTLYQKVFSGPGGLDPYAAAVSDVYQDLFGEGSYTGKGIYDVDAFEAALAGRVPENTLLSHDLFEGIYARAGLVTDIEVFEDFPARYDVAVKRQHRWTRGDWQLLPWIFGLRRGPGGLPSVGRGKMLDNLRRSLLPPFTLLTLGVCWLLPLPASLLGTAIVLAAIAIPPFLPVLFGVMPPRGIRLRNHLRALAGDLRLAAMQSFFALAFLPDQAWRMCDAILRTLVRLGITRRHLLEWTTAAQVSSRPTPGVEGFYRKMAPGTALGLLIAAGAVLCMPSSWPVALPVVLLWLSAPAVAYSASRTPPAAHQAIAAPTAQALRLVARRTWRFFETFVTPADHMLPPDNFQEDPAPVVARRTSPTNMGLYLLSAVAARDFGWAGTVETVERLEATLDTMVKLPRYNGHFYNWYATADLRPLEPAYVSSVDSGNLAGHLITLANACESWIGEPLAPNARLGVLDTLQLVRETLGAKLNPDDRHGRQLAALLDEFETQLNGAQWIETLPSLKRYIDKAGRTALEVVPAGEGDRVPEAVYWIEALRKTLAEHARDRLQREDTQALDDRLRSIAARAREMAHAMDFSFLLDRERKLLSIGYSLADNRLDQSCYDLLASEARLASLVAIAKGDVPTQHWFRLGRTATPVRNGSALISWSGSMFEYLMPSLVMRAPADSLLEQTNRLAVRQQQDYGASLNIPWGMSESAFNARDLEYTYQYSNFGVPALGLKRGLSENIVVAPYATGLAAMIDPYGSVQNYNRIAALGGLGRYGYYEALDFTRSRLHENENVAIVRTYMAHHQGMTIVAIANVIHAGEMRARFHREPMIQASELLLQERMPRVAPIMPPRAEEISVAAWAEQNEGTAARRLEPAPDDAPVTHLLSNGRYAVMLTASGSGYSRWRDIAVTRWREDATRDDWGSFIFLRDADSGKRWSVGAQPLGWGDGQRSVVFDEDHAEFSYREGALTTTMNVVVSGEDDGEVRRLSLVNSGRQPRVIEVTSYAEIVLTTPAADEAHPAFAKLFVQTEFLEEFGAIVATRRPRAQNEPPIWAAHFAVVEGEAAAAPQYESDRARFIGRSRTIATATAIVDARPLSNTVGTVLDPVFALRHRVTIPPGGEAHIAFWTVVAPTRETLIDLIDKNHDRHAYERARTLAWTQAQIQLRHLGVKPDEAADFQRFAAPLIYADSRFRAMPETLLRGADAQSALWPHAISGDLPIVLLHIDEMEDMAQVRQLLRAHEYWRMKRLGVDLVIVNERSTSYVQDLQNAIDTAVRTSRSIQRTGPALARGSIYVLRADLLSVQARAMLRAAARVTLIARRGPLAAQFTRLPRLPAVVPPAPARASTHTATTRLQRPELEFYNGLGGFDKNGREYVVVLDADRTTPAPWINVVANPDFGFQVSAEGSAYTWSENSRENQLTPWSNDPVTDPTGEAIYVRDEESLELWSPTAQPIRDGGTYIARHGHGYSRFEHRANGIALDLLQYVPLSDPIKISRLRLRNLSGRRRRLSVTTYAEWVLGTSRGASAPRVLTEIDRATGALFARNPWAMNFGSRIAFADLRGEQSAWTADRTEFLGRNGTLAAPAALARDIPLSGATGAGLDPCAALQRVIELEPDESIEVVAFLGQCETAEDAHALIARYRSADLDAVYDEVVDHWQTLPGTIQVRTPDRAMDIMLNGWLLYQALACRIWARSAFYQASGAYGFRDQLQDGMALTFARPEATRHHLLRAAGRQFAEGDVQHWWLPHSGQGVRTRISDDRVWLAYAAATYIAATGDAAVLDEQIPFLEGPAVSQGEHDAFFQPMTAEESASLFEHCARGLDQCLALTGKLGLPLIGTGDWNDGMNRVGEGGKGESVWLAWLLLRTIELFAPYADKRDPERARRWRAHAESVRRAIETKAWDGEWYRRATFDDGAWLGSKDSEECCIDSIAQSWAVLSGAADPDRARKAMASLEQHLIRRDDGIALLFTPPFDRMARDPGYIKSYPPGLRENGGQYSHAAMWVVLAFAKLGEGDKAGELFALLNPINHSRTPEEAERYKVEPYVVAADVYSVAPHAGRGGWTWYTGSAGWMYRAGIEGLLGIRREGATLVIDPCIPADWPGFEATVRIASTRCDIVVENASKRCRGVAHATVDDVPVDCEHGVRVSLNGGTHRILITL